MERKNGCYYRQSGLLSILMNGDFEEQDVWDVNGTKGNHFTPTLDAYGESETPQNHNHPRLLITSSAKTTPTTQNAETNDPQSAKSEAKVIHQKSEPMKIPANWSKMKPNKDSSQREDGDDANAGRESDDDDYMVPPHEVIANRLARSHISNLSMFEGVGRTLKGRDLSRVRNAVLVKTGFLEP